MHSQLSQRFWMQPRLETAVVGLHRVLICGGRREDRLFRLGPAEKNTSVGCRGREKRLLPSLTDSSTRPDQQFVNQVSRASPIPYGCFSALVSDEQQHRLLTRRERNHLPLAEGLLRARIVIFGGELRWLTKICYG